MSKYLTKGLPKILRDHLNHQNLTALINFVEFPLAREGSRTLLPEGAEATTDMLVEDIQNLKVAYDLLQNSIHQCVSNLKPDWIITDILTHWTVDIARELKKSH